MLGFRRQVFSLFVCFQPHHFIYFILLVLDFLVGGGVLPFAWMDLEDILLSEVSQMEKDKYHMISLICEI